MVSMRRTWPRRRLIQRLEEFWTSGGHGGGGEEFAATAARATTVGRMRRVPSELVDSEQVREGGEMAAGIKWQQRLRWWQPSPRLGKAWRYRTASRGRGRWPHLGGVAAFGGGVGGRLSVERRSRWQWRPAGVRGAAGSKEDGLAQEVQPMAGGQTSVRGASGGGGGRRGAMRRDRW
uniref:Uncharacterized protein n=1 Tax=Oryza meridionalis TaxID=40149 RepID=A0A0E0F4E1_9ORYZ